MAGRRPRAWPSGCTPHPRLGQLRHQGLDAQDPSGAHDRPRRADGRAAAGLQEAPGARAGGLGAPAISQATSCSDKRMVPPIHPDLFSQGFEKLVRDSGLPRIRLHGLRHTRATIALRAGVPVKVISERLGHEDPAFTMKQYAHVIPGMQAEVSALVARVPQDLTALFGQQAGPKGRCVSNGPPGARHAFSGGKATARGDLRPPRYRPRSLRLSVGVKRSFGRSSDRADGADGWGKVRPGASDGGLTRQTKWLLDATKPWPEVTPDQGFCSGGGPIVALAPTRTATVPVRAVLRLDDESAT